MRIMYPEGKGGVSTGPKSMIWTRSGVLYEMHFFAVGGGNQGPFTVLQHQVLMDGFTNELPV